MKSYDSDLINQVKLQNVQTFVAIYLLITGCFLLLLLGVINTNITNKESWIFSTWRKTQSRLLPQHHRLIQSTKAWKRIKLSPKTFEFNFMLSLFFKPYVSFWSLLSKYLIKRFQLKPSFLNYSGEQKSKTCIFLDFFSNNFDKIKLYLSSNISLKRAPKIILILILIDFFFLNIIQF